MRLTSYEVPDLPDHRARILRRSNLPLPYPHHRCPQPATLSLLTQDDRHFLLHLGLPGPAAPGRRWRYRRHLQHAVQQADRYRPYDSWSRAASH